MSVGQFVFMLHSHLPYYRKAGMWPFGEENLYECMAETYVPLLNAISELYEEGIKAKLTVGITPILAEQLNDEHLKQGFVKYLDSKCSQIDAIIEKQQTIIEKLKEQKGTIYVSKFDEDPKLSSFRIDVEIGSEKYKLIYWAKKGVVSVHQGMDCTLCGYDKYHSDIAVEIMKEKIKRAFNNADEEAKRMTEELMGEW